MPISIILGPTQPQRAVVVTTNPPTLPNLTTWYLTTNLPAPVPEPLRDQPLPVADLAEIVQLSSVRGSIEQRYKQRKHSLGWAQYQVRSDVAMRRHWMLVCVHFPFAGGTTTMDSPQRRHAVAWQVVRGHALPSRVHTRMPSKKSGTGQPGVQPRVTWPMALRAVRAWLDPWMWLWRYGRAWTNVSPPVELQHLLDTVGAGYGLNVYTTS